jgi:Tfp pilus assembly protein PilE
MGQQQLLLIVLGVIIVGVAIAVGVNQFKSSAVDSNRQAIVSDLLNLGAKAQRYYRTPTTLGGGGQDFNGFTLNTLDQSNSNGAYRLLTSVAGIAADASAATGTTSISSSVTTIYIVGWGTETGNNATNPVKTYVTVTADAIMAVQSPVN